MLLEISTTETNATDIGYLLHKNPENVFERSLSFGVMRVFYPEGTLERSTASLWLDLDQASLVRRHGKTSFSLSQYVNDRPYVGSSYLSVALGQAFGTALSGHCEKRPELVTKEWKLTASIPALDCDSGESFIRELFEPLGYVVEIETIVLGSQFPDPADSTLYSLKLHSKTTVQEILNHLYILLPVIDNQKHYAFGRDEIAKLVDNAGRWLASHPNREIIAKRYLRYKSEYVFDALQKLAEDSDDEEPAAIITAVSQEIEDSLEKTVSLHQLRLDSVMQAVNKPGAQSIVDLGCGEGKLMSLLSKERQWKHILGMDISSHALQIASRKLYLDRGRTDDRIKLIQGSLLYRDDRIAGFDVAAMVEVIEHIELDRLEFMERVVFGYAKPGRLVVTTPNADYNPHWQSLPAGKMRHNDHRFEWSRAQFEHWATSCADRFGYLVEISGIGEVDGDLGCPSQMAVFDKT